MHRGHAVGVLLEHVRKIPSAMTPTAKSLMSNADWLILEDIVRMCGGIRKSLQGSAEAAKPSSFASLGSADNVN